MQRKNIVLLLSFVFIILIIFGMNVVPYFSLSNTNNDVIKIGGLLPLTGSLAYQGADIKKGLDMAIDEINSNSGIKGCNLKIVYEDFGSDFKQAVEGYQKLTKIDEVKIIVPSYGDTVLAIAPLAEQDEVISFAVASGSPKISIAGDFTFRNNLLPQDEVKEMANYIYNIRNTKEIALLAINTESGNSYMLAFQKEYELLGGKVLLLEKTDKSEINFISIITKFKTRNVENIFMILGVEQIGALLNQSIQQGYDPQFYGGYFTENNKLIEIAGENANGIIYTHFFNTETQNAKTFANKFYEKYNEDPNPYAALAYDNIYMLEQAIEKCANTNDSVCIKDNLYNVQIDGVTGKTYFDKNGDTIKQIYLKTVKNSEFVLIK